MAIVGTRRPTQAGLDLAIRAATSAVAAGLGVISGLAPGIDTAAHEAALEAGGRTWAVLGSGVDALTPEAGLALAERIVSCGGGLVSELEPGTGVRPRYLVARDRIQSGLSLAVVVCQCETSSGTMHTARFAIEQGRLLAVAAPVAAGLRQRAWSGNRALCDPEGCDPALLSARGALAAAVSARRPVADVVWRSDADLVALWRRLPENYLPEN